MPSTYKASTYAACALWLEESKVQYKPNPKSGKSFQRYAAYEKASTVGEALHMGALPADLLFDFEHGHLAVTEPLREKPLDLFAMKSFEELTYTDKVLCRYSYLADPSKSSEMDSDRIQVLEESIRKQRATFRRLRKMQMCSVLEIKEIDSVADSVGFWESPLMMARRSMANQQAREILELIEAEGRKVSDFEVLSVLRLWDFRENTTRCNVMKPGQTFIYSDTVGLVADRTGNILAKEETRRYPQFGQFLCRWLRDHIPDELGTDFVFTSININKNYAGRLHRDGSNVGPSCIKAFGEFKGGQLNYFAEDDRSVKLEVLEELAAGKSAKLDVAHGLAVFDGKRGHWVDDFEGEERYSLVFFTCPRFERISDATRQVMNAAGFPLPDETTIAKLLTVLRPPRGYGEAKSASKASQAVKSIHDSPYLFWAHDSSSRLEQEVKAWEFWQRRGMRAPIAKDAPRSISRVEWEHRGNKRNVNWNEDHLYLILPGEPERKDLILEGYRNMVDAVTFLNDPESEVPKAVTDAGCCAVFSVRTRVWYCLYHMGRKEDAMATFGLEAELAQPKRGQRPAAATEAAAAPAAATARPQATPPRKRGRPTNEAAAASAAKKRRSAVEPAAAAGGKPSPSGGKRIVAKKLVKPRQPKAAPPAAEEGAGKRPCMSTDRRSALQQLSACTAETSIQFKPSGKTVESHPGSYQRYEAYQSATTMREAVDMGAIPGDFIHDWQAGLLMILDTCPRAPPQKTGGEEAPPKSRFDSMARRWRDILAHA